MEAIGMNLKGDEVILTSFTHPFFKDKEILEADSFNLLELDVPEGIVYLSCRNNSLRRLDFPESLELVICEKELFDYNVCITENVNIYYEELEKEED